MEQNNRDFKGIWIPKEVWLSKELTLQEKVFLVEIDSLDGSDGCFAGNKYFADFFGISRTRVSLVIKSLVEKQYITSTIVYKRGTKQILKRVLKKSYRPPLTKVKDPTQGKLIDNNTTNNTINKSKESKKKKDEIKISPTPSKKKMSREEKVQEKKEKFYARVALHIGEYTPEMLRAFYEYWSEVSDGSTILAWEKQRTFEVKKRLSTWKNLTSKFDARKPKAFNETLKSIKRADNTI